MVNREKELQDIALELLNLYKEGEETLIHERSITIKDDLIDLERQCASYMEQILGE